MLDRLEGRAFRTFIAVLEEGSISKAAERLGYVQSTVTTQMRLLEESLGRRLFDRLPRGVEPTEAGKRLAEYAYRFLALGEELEQGLAQTDEPRGTVRLRVLESFGAEFLWGPLKRFFAAYPRVTVEVDTGFQSDILAALRAREIDLGLIPAGSGGLEHDVAFAPLLEDELVWTASPSEARRIAAQGWPSLEGARIIGYGVRCMYASEAQAMLQREGVRRFTQIEFASLGMIGAAVGSGWGVALLPRASAAAGLASGALAECPELGAVPFRHGLIRLKRRELSAPAHALYEHLSKCGMNKLMVE